MDHARHHQPAHPSPRISYREEKREGPLLRETDKGFERRKHHARKPEGQSRTYFCCITSSLF